MRARGHGRPRCGQVRIRCVRLLRVVGAAEAVGSLPLACLIAGSERGQCIPFLFPPKIS